MKQTDQRNLSLLIFPQEWSGTEIVANILLLPTGDPTLPVGSELPFAQAQPVLRAAFLPGFATPSWAPPPASLVTSALFNLIPPGPEGPQVKSSKVACPCPSLNRSRRRRSLVIALLALLTRWVPHFVRNPQEEYA